MKSRSPHLPHLVLVGVLGVAALALGLTVDVVFTGVAGVKVDELPERVGAWEGEAILYCSSQSCQQEFLGEECEGLEVCTVCGAPVRTMSYAEWKQLPKDTTLIRKRYDHPNGRTLVAAVVLSGKNRSSIHRPEVCLTGNGRDITRSRVIPVVLKDGRTLKVMMLDMTYPVRGTDGSVYQAGSYYAYWFAGRSRQTAYHGIRMLWMAWEKVAYGRTDRWAYIAVAGSRDLASDGHLEEASSFIQEFFPLIQIDADDPATNSPVRQTGR